MHPPLMTCSDKTAQVIGGLVVTVHRSCISPHTVVTSTPDTTLKGNSNRNSTITMGISSSSSSSITAAAMKVTVVPSLAVGFRGSTHQTSTQQITTMITAARQVYHHNNNNCTSSSSSRPSSTSTSSSFTPVAQYLEAGVERQWDGDRGRGCPTSLLCRSTLSDKLSCSMPTVLLENNNSVALYV